MPAIQMPVTPLHRLLWLYPEMPTADQLKLAYAANLERKRDLRGAIRILRDLEVEMPGGQAGQQASRRLQELRDSGVAVPPRTHEQDRATSYASDAHRAVVASEVRS